MERHAVVICERCRTPTGSTAERGEQILIGPETLSDVLALMTGTADRDLCDVCMAPLSSRPRIVVSLSDRRAHVLPGSAPDDPDVARAELSERFSDVCQHDDADALRRAVLDELRPAAVLYELLAAAPTDDAAKHLMDHRWAEMDGRVVLTYLGQEAGEARPPGHLCLKVRFAHGQRTVPADDRARLAAAPRRREATRTRFVCPRRQGGTRTEGGSTSSVDASQLSDPSQPETSPPLRLPFVSTASRSRTSWP